MTTSEDSMDMWKIWLCVCVWCVCAACSVSTASLDELTCTPGEVSVGRVCNSEGVWVRSMSEVTPPLDMGTGDMLLPPDDMACLPELPACVPSSCGTFTASDGCGAEVSYDCECEAELICDEGVCRADGECELSTARKRALCEQRQTECELISVQDECQRAVTIDCALACDAGSSCVDGACCAPRSVSDTTFVDMVCGTGTQDELCGLKNDVDLGCGLFDTIDCQGCSDPLATCEQGVCEVPACPVNARCGFIEQGNAQLLTCGDNSGECGDARLCENYQCVSSMAISPPANIQDGGMFGHAVALDGDWLVIGEPLASDGRGAVHLYRRNALTRVFQYIKTLNSPSPQAGESFGLSVAIDGDWIAVGAPAQFEMSMDRIDADMVVSEGNVYMFARGGNEWGDPGVPIDKTLLELPTNHALGAFGYDVALDGATLVVGAPLRSARITSSMRRIGGVFVFESSEQGTPWASGQELSYPGSDDFLLGFSVDLRADGVVGGAPELADRFGALYIWLRDAPRSWSDPPRVGRPDRLGTRFGYDVALNLSDAYVGEPGYESGTGQVLGGGLGSGTFAAVLSPFPAIEGGYFGSAVAVGERTFVAGASGFNIFESASTPAVESKVYVRRLDSGGVPTTEARLLTLSSQEASSRWVGVSLDVSDGVVAVGAPHKTSAAQSRVYVLKGF